MTSKLYIPAQTDSKSISDSSTRSNGPTLPHIQHLKVTSEGRTVKHGGQTIGACQRVELISGDGSKLPVSYIYPLTLWSLSARAIIALF